MGTMASAGLFAPSGARATSSEVSAAQAAPPITPIRLDCLPSGAGHDYQVGPGAGQLAELDQVPWDRLSGGDTVRIFHRDRPYAGKFIVSAQASAKVPVRICGVRGPNGDRPIITGENAVTRPGSDYGHPLHQSRSVIVVKPLASQGWQAYPRHVRIDGLHIRSAHPSYSFTDDSGSRQRYEAFGACVWIERGHDIVIADNEIEDCSQGIVSRSTDDGDFAVTRRIRLVGNYLHDNGIAGNDRVHASYMQSADVVYEFNRYGPMRRGAGGNAIKDRSIGTVVRYNRIEDGARALDLVEAEDNPRVAMADPAYRSTYVYGNQIVKHGETGSTIHYGGDHTTSTPGALWGEPIFRKGTLYFFNNTVYVRGSGYAVLFQLSTTEERAQIWNNVFVFDRTVPLPLMRSTTEVGAAWTPGGILSLGRNWIDDRWVDASRGARIGGQVLGVSNLLDGSTPPVNLQTLRPLTGSAIIDAGIPGPSEARGYPVEYQLGHDFQPVARKVSGTAIDLGAIESLSGQLSTAAN